MKHLHHMRIVLLSCASLLLCAVAPVRGGIRREAEALVNWKASLAGPNKSLTSWSLANSTSPCSWAYISCNLAGHITEMYLIGASLNGTLDSFDFLAFPHLEVLSLSENGMYGIIPAGIGNLTSLVELVINNNPYLTGGIPRSIGQLKHLSTLELIDLGLDATLPEELGNLTSLVELRFISVTLTGSIPPTIGMLTKLKYFFLGNNDLTGSIPMEIGNMTKLWEMDFSCNHLEGQLPGTISHLSELWSLYMSENQLEGEIFPELGNSSSLNTVDIAKNNFSGLFPSSICVRGELGTINVGYNGFTGIHRQTFQNCTSLESIDFTSNKIVADLRDYFGQDLELLQKMSFSQNQLHGTLLTDLDEVFLCNCTYLHFLDLSNNALHGGISKCLGHLPRLIFMDLSKNYLSGVVPLSCKHNLLYLYLANNHFSGTFPSGLQKCKNLITLDLGGNNFLGTIPSWISKSLPKLRFLQLSKNMFDGIIPQEILQFRQLQVLDLSNNKLTGPVPNDFTNFTGMVEEPKSFDYGRVGGNVYQGLRNLVLKHAVWKYKYQVFNVTAASIVGIDLSCNSLSQDIPDGITTLLGLTFLNLSGNHLSSSIPKDIGNLVLLESLDLSRNQLSGEIPPSFAGLKSITVLNLSTNELSGRIPMGNQLQTLVDPSIYRNNPGLCGFPLDECVNSSTSTQSETSQAEDREEIWVYCFVAAGFISGFWLYWGMFFFRCETWRCAFYQSVDNMQGKVAKKIYSCMSCFQARGPE